MLPNRKKSLLFNIIAVLTMIQLAWLPMTAQAQPKEAATISLPEKIAVMEINYYLSKMGPDELAATLKIFRAAQVVKGQYVGAADGVNLMTGAVKGLVNALGDPYSVYMDPKCTAN